MTTQDLKLFSCLNTLHFQTNTSHFHALGSRYKIHLLSKPFSVGLDGGLVCRPSLSVPVPISWEKNVHMILPPIILQLFKVKLPILFVSRNLVIDRINTSKYSVTLLKSKILYWWNPAKTVLTLLLKSRQKCSNLSAEILPKMFQLYCWNPAKNVLTLLLKSCQKYSNFTDEIPPKMFQLYCRNPAKNILTLLLKSRQKYSNFTDEIPPCSNHYCVGRTWYVLACKVISKSHKKLII